MRTTTMAFTAVMAMLLIACSDSPLTAPTTSKRMSADAASLDRGDSRDDLVQVTGHAAFFSDFRNTLMTYSVSAIRHRDGSFSGELELVIGPPTSARIHGHTACFANTGNVSNLVAVVDQSSHPDVRVGSLLAWTLQDNGEGRRSTPDLTSSFMLFNDPAVGIRHCAAPFGTGAIFPVVAGNLQVHE